MLRRVNAKFAAEIRAGDQERGGVVVEGNIRLLREIADIIEHNLQYADDDEFREQALDRLVAHRIDETQRATVDWGNRIVVVEDPDAPKTEMDRFMDRTEADFKAKSEELRRLSDPYRSAGLGFRGWRLRKRQ